MEGRIVKISGKIIFLIFVVVALCLPAVFMNSIYGYFPILFFLITSLISVICMNRIKKSMTVRADFLTGECERGSTVSIVLHIVNHSRLICPKAVASFHVLDLFGKESAQVKTGFTVASKADADLGFDVDMPHVGVYKVGIRKIRIYGFFGYFSCCVSLAEDLEVLVKPKIRSIEEIKEGQVAIEESNKDVKMSIAGGSDYVGVREYAIGDSMKQIHWKLSAHSLGYMSKVYESSRQNTFSVILDFCAIDTANPEKLMDLNDCLIETAFSIIEQVSRQHTSYCLLYADSQKNIKRVDTPKRNDISLIKDFPVISSKKDIEDLDAEQILQNENLVANRSSNVIVCTTRVTDELLQELLSTKRQDRNPELYIMILSEWNTRQKQTLTSRLREIDEANIPYHVVTTREIA